MLSTTKLVNSTIFFPLVSSPMKDIGTRVKSRMEELEISQKELAKMCGVVQQAISHVVTGRIARPKFIVELAKALQTTPEWLTEGVDYLPTEEKLAHKLPTEVVTIGKQSAIKPNVTRAPHLSATFGPDSVPILGHANGSEGEYMILNFDEPVGETLRHPKQTGLKNAFAVYARGNSMYPQYEEGQIIYCLANTPPQVGQSCVVELKNGEAYLKRFLARTEKKMTFLQHKPNKEISWPISEIKAIHAVVGTG